MNKKRTSSITMILVIAAIFLAAYGVSNVQTEVSSSTAASSVRGTMGLTTNLTFEDVMQIATDVVVAEFVERRPFKGVATEFEFIVHDRIFGNAADRIFIYVHNDARFNLMASGHSYTADEIQFTEGTQYLLPLMKIADVYSLMHEDGFTFLTDLVFDLDNPSSSTMYNEPLTLHSTGMNFNSRSLTRDAIVSYVSTLTQSNIPAREVIRSENLEGIIEGSPYVLVVDVNEPWRMASEGVQSGLVSTDIYYTTVVDVLKGNMQVGDAVRVVFFADTVFPGEQHIISITPIYSDDPYFYTFTSRHSLHPLSQRDEIIALISGTPPPPSAVRLPTITAGGTHALAIFPTNNNSNSNNTTTSLLSWGWNNWGQAGIATGMIHLTPTWVMDDVVAISAGQVHSMALMPDGTLWGFGWNPEGQVGSGANQTQFRPAQILDDVVYVSTFGTHTMAIRSDNSLWGWGNNWSGQLGNGTSMNQQRNPIWIMDDVVSVSAGSSHTMAIRSDNSLWGWGHGMNGELGIGIATSELSPVHIMDNVASVSAGLGMTMAVRTDGSLWVWGSSGLVGDGTTERRLSPVHIMDDVAWISAGGQYAMAIRTDGSLWAWGWNSSGQIGDGTTARRLSPVWIMDDVVQVSAGIQHTTLAFRTDGSVWGWGSNTDGGIIGDGTTIDRHSPVLVSAGGVLPEMFIAPMDERIVPMDERNVFDINDDIIAFDMNDVELLEGLLQMLDMHIYDRELLVLPGEVGGSH